MKPVKLKDIVNEIVAQSEEFKSYLNKESGEIISVSLENLSIAEDSEEGEDFSRYPEWQQDEIKKAFNMVENWSDYIQLPDQWEVNEYDIMESFCGSIENDKISDALYSAIRGSGAFRRFRDSIIRYGIENDWYSFKEEAIRNIAIEWCNINGISYVV